MYNLIIATKLWILVLDSVEAMRAGSDDRALLRSYSSNAITGDVPIAMIGAGFETVAIERLDILLGHHLPEVFVTDTPCGVARTPFFGTQYSEVDIGGQQDFCYGCCHFLVAPIERTHTADTVEDVGSGVL